MIIDVSDVKSIPALHNTLKERLDFPDYYGANLDALFDILSEKEKHSSISFIGFEMMRNEIGEYADMVIKVFEDAGIGVTI